MNRILMMFVLLCFVGLLGACNGGGGGGSTSNELQEQCQACVEVEDDTAGVERKEETSVEEEDEETSVEEEDEEPFLNEKQFSCLNDKCSKDDACISCLQGTQTNMTLCDQQAVKVCHTNIKEVVSNAGMPSDTDYYPDDEKTKFFKKIEHCMKKGSQEAVTGCAIKGCEKNKNCNPCLMRAKMYCQAYADEINDCVQSQFITHCVIIPSQG